MLETRSAYGYYGSAGGYTGERVPRDENVIYKKMPYYEYKTRYPECENMGDYDKIRKTITVVIPSEYVNRPNFGNSYTIRDFEFEYAPAFAGCSVLACKAKNYKNALASAKRWARKNGKTIVGDAPGHEYQKNLD